jgi:hypothetical protein
MGTDFSVPAFQVSTPRETSAVDRVACPLFQYLRRQESFADSGVLCSPWSCSTRYSRRESST